MRKSGVTYERAVAFYAVLCEAQTPDGYSLRTAGHASERTGISYKTGYRILDALRGIGCVELYQSQVPAVDGRIGKRPQTLTLIKITGFPLDEEMVKPYE